MNFGRLRKVLWLALHPLPDASDWVQIVGVAIIALLSPALIGWFIGVVPAAVVLALLVAGLSVGAAYRLQTDVEALAESKRPKLSIECRTGDGLRVGADRTSIAYLVVRNLGEDEARNAYGKVTVVEHDAMTINDERHRTRREIYQHRDVFLRWDASETRYHSFRTEARLYVAVGEKGSGYRLDAVEPDSLFPSPQVNDTYTLLLEIAAEDLPTFRAKLLLRMREPFYRDGDNKIVLWDAPYNVELREWVDGDDIEGELDYDEWVSSWMSGTEPKTETLFQKFEGLAGSVVRVPNGRARDKTQYR